PTSTTSTCRSIAPPSGAHCYGVTASEANPRKTPTVLSASTVHAPGGTAGTRAVRTFVVCVRIGAATPQILTAVTSFRSHLLSNVITSPALAVVGENSSKQEQPSQHRPSLPRSALIVSPMNWPRRWLLSPRLKSARGAQIFAVTEPFRPNVTGPLPRRKMVTSPHWAPSFVPSPTRKKPPSATSTTAGVSADTIARLPVPKEQTSYVPPVSTSVARLWTSTSPYAPGARSQRLFPGTASGAPTQSAFGCTVTSSPAWQGGNGSGKPQSRSTAA